MLSALILCDVCNKAYSQQSHLVQHIHSGARPYICEVCSKVFNQQCHLAQHKLYIMLSALILVMCVIRRSFGRGILHNINVYSGERPYTCDVCNKAFSQQSYLVQHKLIHSSERHYTCDVCNMAFNQHSSLTLHKRTHNGDCPYTCDVCNKAFSLHSNLIRHQLVHSVERPYICNVCNKAFSQKISLITHHYFIVVTALKAVNCAINHKTNRPVLIFVITNSVECL
jgi:KRAB domain-containing zinc finger protein